MAAAGKYPDNDGPSPERKSGQARSTAVDNTRYPITRDGAGDEHRNRNFANRSAGANLQREVPAQIAGIRVSMSHIGNNVIVICHGNALKFPTVSFGPSDIERHFHYIRVWFSHISRKAVRSLVAPESGHFTVSHSSCGRSVRHKLPTFH